MLWHSLLIIAVTFLVGALALLRHKKHETQIRALKPLLKEQVQKLCAAANAGDEQSVKKLEAFKESITEQSVRLTGRPKPPTTVIKGGIPGL